jgi:hypothetical protein
VWGRKKKRGRKAGKRDGIHYLYLVVADTVPAGKR